MKNRHTGTTETVSRNTDIYIKVSWFPTGCLTKLGEIACRNSLKSGRQDRDFTNPQSASFGSITSIVARVHADSTEERKTTCYAPLNLGATRPSLAHASLEIINVELTGTGNLETKFPIQELVM